MVTMKSNKPLMRVRSFLLSWLGLFHDVSPGHRDVYRHERPAQLYSDFCDRRTFF